MIEVILILTQMNKDLIFPYHGQCTTSNNDSYFSYRVAGGNEGLKCITVLSTSFTLQSSNTDLTKQWAVTIPVHLLFHKLAIKHIHKTKNHLYLVSHVFHRLVNFFSDTRPWQRNVPGGSYYFWFISKCWKQMPQHRNVPDGSYS
jgi:hypothetical protein